MGPPGIFFAARSALVVILATLVVPAGHLESGLSTETPLSFKFIIVSIISLLLKVFIININISAQR